MPHVVDADNHLVFSGLASFGCVARDHEVLCLLLWLVPHVHALSPVVAEAFACCWAMSLAEDLGFRRIYLEIDCL